MTTIKVRMAAVAILSLLVVAVAVPRGRAYASTAQHDIMIGLAVSTAYLSQGWHSPGVSLDLQNSGGSTSGVSVYSQTKWVSGNAMTAYKQSYISYCNGIKVSYQTSGGTELGRTAYVHINVSSGIPSSWTLGVYGWTVEYLGTVIDPEPSPYCSWTGAHLHQSEEVATSSYNTSLQGGSSYSTGSTWLEHMSD